MKWGGTVGPRESRVENAARGRRDRADLAAGSGAWRVAVEGAASLHPGGPPAGCEASGVERSGLRHRRRLALRARLALYAAAAALLFVLERLVPSPLPWVRL